MTARADRLTKRARTAEQSGAGRSSYPASSLRVFADALERLDYSIGPLLADAGISRADLDDPDGRVPSQVWNETFCRALEQHPMKNAGMRLATVTPIGAFPLIDYLIVTSEDVGEGLSRLERYLRLAEARSIPSLRRAENPIRVAYLLGYSEPAAFNRAFRCWHHETPQSFRQRQRTGRVQ